MMLDKETKFFLLKLRLPLLICTILLVIMVIQEFLGIKLSYYGIYPRHWEGLLGIVFAPFLHSSWAHLFSNLVPLFVLILLMESFYERVSVVTLTALVLITGMLVWVFARNSFHVGASGVVYGLISFVFWSGLFRGNTRSIILALIILVVYSSYFDGIKPREGVSWESHLFGALAGITLAFILKNVKEEGEEEEVVPSEINESKALFFPPDTFEMTKAERIAKAEREEKDRIVAMERALREMEEDI